MELLLDVRWMLTFLTLFNLLDLKVLCIPVCNNIIVGNSTHNSAGEVTSPGFPALQSTTYTCLFEFEGRSSGEYLELIFTDFILDSQDTVACHGSVDLLYTVSIRENVRQGPGVRHCERPKRHVFSLTGLATLELKSRSQHILQAFRATYRFLNASEGRDSQTNNS
ncbi:uncharacterized protein [Amphiura filiformis]|uniref:uncharacterized protein n=1 Tax=Amphiura filiformis TaxID=82378 RepID=UPI003B212D3E